MQSILNNLSIRYKPILLFGMFMTCCTFSLSTGMAHLPKSESIDSDKKLMPGQLNVYLLQKAILKYTNLERVKYQLKPLSVLNTLEQAANQHSREMASMHYFSHQSPVKQNQELTDRLKNAGFRLVNVTVGENIGVDYFLEIANIPFYTATSYGRTIYRNANTGRPIDYQTYEGFAYRMVQNWMKSPPHRKNILNAQYERIGCGIAAGIYQDMKAIYVTQNFSGSIRPPFTISPTR